MTKILLAITFAFCTSMYGQIIEKIGLQGSYNINSLDYFDKGHHLKFYAEIPFNNKWYLLPKIGINGVTHYDEKKELDGMVILKEEANVQWYMMSLSALYELYSFTEFKFRVGIEPSLQYFSAHRDLFTDKLLIESEFRWGVDALVNFELDRLFQSHFGMNINLAFGYISGTELSVDAEYYKSIRPFKNYSLSQFQLGLSYEL